MDYKLMQIAKETQNITRLGYYNVNNERIELLKVKNMEFSLVEAFSSEILRRFYANIYLPELSKQKAQYAKIKVIEKDSFEAARDYINPLVMNFASATHKGGGFLKGSHAQEESLCRCSTLYASLTDENAQQYYEYNRSLHSPLYSDYMLLSPNVCVFRNARLNLLQKPYNVAVATVPAPNLRTIHVAQAELTLLMLKRIRLFLSMAAQKGYKNLILGAWGCGAFRHNPYDVAKYFHKVLLDEGFAALFDNIVFAIVKNNDNLTAFRKVLSERNSNALDAMRIKENLEITDALFKIESIVNTKCSRCNNLLGCLGCNLNDLKQDIEHAKEMMKAYDA